MVKTLLIILISYLFGSIPWALIIGKVFYHKDIRKYGSGNLGASNAGRVLGKPAAVIVTVLDAIKAVISMAIASLIYKEAIPFAGVACCVGHCFPIFANFKGGKAVATTYGYFLGLALFVNHSWLWQFFLPIIVFFAMLYATKIVSISSMTAIGIEVLLSVLVIHNDWKVTICLLLLWAFIVYRHKDNIKRIQAGTENKIKWMG